MLRSRLYSLSDSDIRFKYNQLYEETQKTEALRGDELNRLKRLLGEKDMDIEKFFSELKSSESIVQNQKEIIQELKENHGITFEADSIIEELKYKEKEVAGLKMVSIHHFDLHIIQISHLKLNKYK